MSEVKTKNCISASLSQNPFINSFVAYPNPTNEFLYFKNINSNASIQSISVYNLLGMNCNSLIENGNDFIDVRKLKEGIYNLIIVEESGKKSTNYFYKNGN